MSEELKPPILLIGNVRSGTSMMARLFDAHPEVTGWPEPRTVWTYADPARPHDRFDADDATPRVRRWIRRRFLAYQRRHGGLRVMEKTPSNVLRIPYVHAIFPESKLLYLIREHEKIAIYAGSLERVHSLVGVDPWPAGYRDWVRSGQRRPKARHVYSLEEFGLSAHRLASDLAKVYEAYRFIPGETSRDG